MPTKRIRRLLFALAVLLAGNTAREGPTAAQVPGASTALAAAEFFGRYWRVRADEYGFPRGN